MRPYMTEDAAAQKFCPVADCGGDGNRSLDGKPQSFNRCLGSDCMGWGWKPERDHNSLAVCRSTTHGRCEMSGGS